MTNQQLLRRLKNAYVTCFDCGAKYGVYSVGCSSVWNGKCDVCGETKPITETRDFAYFVTGIRKLTKEIEDEKSNSSAEVKESEEQTLQCDG